MANESNKNVQLYIVKLGDEMSVFHNGGTLETIAVLVSLMQKDPMFESLFTLAVDSNKAFSKHKSDNADKAKQN